MSGFDFSALANTTTWSDSNFAQDTTTYSQGQVVSQTANGSLHAVVSPTGGTATTRAKLVNRTWANVIGAKVTLCGVRGFAVTDDSCSISLLIESGANAWKGYTWRVGNAFQRLGILNLSNDDDISDSPNAALAAGTADTIAEGDTFELIYTQSTGVLIGKHNGVQLTTATDTTYANAGLTASFEALAGNHGGTGISRFDTTGDSTGGVTVTPTAGGTSVAGNTPTATRVTNSVIQTFTARHGERVLQPERKIFLPRRRAA